VLSAKDAYRSAMRDELLTAAQAVVARKGLAGLTIREVLAEAGVAPGTLYAYFDGKDELLAAMAQKVADRALVPDSAGDLHSASAVLWAMLSNAFAEPLEGATFLADVRGRAGGPEQGEAVKRINTDIVDGVRLLVEQARVDGDLDIDDPDAFAELLDIAWDGMSRREGAGTFVTSYERVGVLLLELLRATAT
jgi:AcrR family transcriptional regulator